MAADPVEREDDGLRSLLDEKISAVAAAAFLDGKSPEALGELFADAGFLASSCAAIAGLRHATPESATTALERAFSLELAPIAKFSLLLTSASSVQLDSLATKATALVWSIATRMHDCAHPATVAAFATTALRKIEKLARRESDQLLHPALASGIEHSIYRAFDELDRAFAIDYGLDIGMFTDPENAERLYEGAGLGVQTSYMTLVLALETLRLPHGSKVIDLGSGYGRMGLVVGLLRPDLEFTGYEFVPHRVAASKASADHAGVGARVRFITQDLSLADFAIPAADAYYLYDPFTEETYVHVFSQLKEIGRKRDIAIVTKGRASAWVAKALTGAEASWESDQTLDLGTLGIFRSRPQRSM